MGTRIHHEEHEGKNQVFDYPFVIFVSFVVSLSGVAD